uniref:Uncharacterized protein n=1 Tax=Coturnix japonica TaxID=93934 RepID=A0A8C2SUJ8_COTJA
MTKRHDMESGTRNMFMNLFINHNDVYSTANQNDRMMPWQEWMKLQQ